MRVGTKRLMKHFRKVRSGLKGLPSRSSKRALGDQPLFYRERRQAYSKRGWRFSRALARRLRKEQR